MKIFVTETAAAIVAVGGIDEAGEITLNYVHPDFTFRGISKKLLGRLESELRSKRRGTGRTDEYRNSSRILQVSGLARRGRSGNVVGNERISHEKDSIDSSEASVVPISHRLEGRCVPGYFLMNFVFTH